MWRLAGDVCYMARPLPFLLYHKGKKWKKNKTRDGMKNVNVFYFDCFTYLFC